MEAEEAEVDEENCTVTVTHLPDVHRKVKKETVLLDKVYDEAALDEEERDMATGEPAAGPDRAGAGGRLVVLGTKQSGKSKVLFGAGDSDKPDTAEQTGSSMGGSCCASAATLEEGFSGKGGRHRGHHDPRRGE